MPQSIQIYTFETARDATRVLDTCKKRVANDKTYYPRMLEAEQNGDNVTGALYVQLGDEMLKCWFAIRPRDGRLVLVGASRGRSMAAEFPAKVVKDKPRRSVVFARQTGVKQMLKLLDNITGQDRRNLINRLTLHFEPEFGRECAQETYTMIAYSSVENRCASKHKDFKSLCKDAKQMEMRLLIRKCEVVVAGPGGQRMHTMVIKPNCTFRMYHDIPLAYWLAFCDAMLGFLNEVAG